MQRETRDRRRSSFIHPPVPEPPGHAADDPRPTQPTLPHMAVRGARARSSQLHQTKPRTTVVVAIFSGSPTVGDPRSGSRRMPFA
eukprot:6188606-Prymnesium_polylepis.1